MRYLTMKLMADSPHHIVNAPIHPMLVDFVRFANRFTSQLQVHVMHWTHDGRVQHCSIRP